MIKHIIYTALLLSLLLNGCLNSTEEEQRVAGGEDFPNTIDNAISAGLNEAGGWNRMDSVAVPLLNTQVQGLDEVSPGGTAPLAKVSAKQAEELELPTDSSKADTLEGKVYVVTWKSNNSLLKVDTVVFKDDVSYRDSIPENDNIIRITGSTFNRFNQARVEYFRTTDADGDGMLSTGEGGSIRARHFVRDMSALNHQEELLIFDAGADGNISTMEDNLIIEGAGISYHLNGDTATVGIFKDADGDGILHPLPENEKNWATYTMKEMWNFSTVVTEIVIGAGPDNDFGDDDNPAALDNVIVSLKVVKLNKTDTLEIYEWEDADGDSVISPEGSAEAMALYRITAFPIIRLYDRQVTEIVLTAGDDLNFEVEGDNKFVSMNMLTIGLNGDTTEYAEASDLDDKGYLFMHGSQEPVSVGYFHIKKQLFTRVESDIRVKVFPADTNQNYFMYLRETTTWNSGAERITTIKGMDSEEISLNDTVLVSVRHTGADTDSLSSMEFTYKAGLGDDIKDDSDNVMYSFRSRYENRVGEESSIDLYFEPEEPVRDGEEAEYGRFELEIVLKTGVTYTLEAEKSADATVVTYTSSNGEEGRMEWNESGELVRWDK